MNNSVETEIIGVNTNNNSEVSADKTVESSPQEQTTQDQETRTPKEQSPNDAKEEDKSQGRLYTRDEVHKIANAERQRAYDKAREELSKQTQRQDNAPAQNVQNNSLMNFTEDDLERKIDQLAERKAVEAKIVDEAHRFLSSIDAEFDTLRNDIVSKSPEMEEACKTLHIKEMPPVYINILSSVDNVKDVLLEMAEYPEKLTSIMSTANTLGLDAGKKALKRLSESIKSNQQAKKITVPKPPLSEISNSVNIGKDDGQMNAADYRKLYKGRF